MTAIKLTAADNRYCSPSSNCLVKKAVVEHVFKEKFASTSLPDLRQVRTKSERHLPKIEIFKYIFQNINSLLHLSLSSNLSQTPCLCLPLWREREKRAVRRDQFEKEHLQCTKACGKIFYSLMDFCNVDKELFINKNAYVNICPP